MAEPGQEALQGVLLATGPWGLAAVCALEPSVLPLSPDMVLTALVLTSLDAGIGWTLALAGIASVACLIGSIASYWLGAYGGHWIFGRVLSPEGLARVERFQARYGVWALFLAALLPLPYKWFVLAAGSFRSGLPAVCLACGVGRTIRFFALALLVYWLGDSARLYLKGGVYVVLGVGLIAIGVVLLRRRRDRVIRDAEAK
jgi:membrane protein YqaA with SNARE-associated domain